MKKTRTLDEMKKHWIWWKNSKSGITERDERLKLSYPTIFNAVWPCIERPTILHCEMNVWSWLK